MTTLELRTTQLNRLVDYFSALMTERFSGNVKVSFDQGILQPNIKREQNDKIIK